MSAFALPSSAAPGFRRLKMTRATTITFNSTIVVAAAAAAVVTHLARRGEGGGVEETLTTQAHSCQTFVYRITSEGLQERAFVFALEHYLASRALLWAGHVAQMHKNRLPKRLVLSWIQEPRIAGGQEMTYGRSLQRHLNHFDLPTVLTEWVHLAQDRAR